MNIISAEIDSWNGINGEIEYLLNKTTIINNSWGKNIEQIGNYLGYNLDAEYYDWYIYRNPELINVISSGNSYDKGFQEIDNLALSRNSTIVGSLNLETNKKYFYSQIGNINNYISVLTPGFYNFKSPIRQDNIDYYFGHGTSYSAPVVTAIASMLKQEYSYIFDKGADSIIFKSALLTGSIKNKNQNSDLDNFYGAGIPNYENIVNSLKNTTAFKRFEKKILF